MRRISGTDGWSDSVAAWRSVSARIPKAGRGRQPNDLSVMLRVHCVQLFYNLSDPGMEDLLYEAESVRRFVGLRLSEALPDESTILHFRQSWRSMSWGRVCLRRSKVTGVPGTAAEGRDHSGRHHHRSAVVHQEPGWGARP